MDITFWAAQGSIVLGAGVVCALIKPKACVTGKSITKNTTIQAFLFGAVVGCLSVILRLLFS